MKRIFAIFFAVFCVFCAHSQNIENVKKHIEILSSEKFHGRGYVANGGNLSAKYIADEFEKIGVKQFNKSYFQEFAYDINTFPNKMEVSIDGKKLTAGTDFVVGQFTPTVKSTYELFVPDSVLLNDTLTFLSKYLSEDWSKKMLVIDYAQTANKEIKSFYIKVLYGNSRFGGIIELIPDNLLSSVGSRQFPYPNIKIKREVFDKSSKSISVNITAKLKKDYKVKNVIGYIEGKNTDEYFVFCAHYDHLGTIGKDVFIPGAQDNASGTAMVLDLAEYYSKNTPECNIVFMLFFGEEAGLLGSSYYVENPLFPLEKIKMGVNLDLVGTGDDSFAIVNSGEKEYADVWKLFSEINEENNYFKNIKQRGSASNSDHHSFNRKGVKAVFIYTMGGQTYYHNVKDKLETLTFAGYENLFALLTKFVERYE